MRNLILRWWFRKWSNWEYDDVIKIYDNDYSTRPIRTYELYKSTSNDGLVKYKRIRR